MVMRSVLTIVSSHTSPGAPTPTGGAWFIRPAALPILLTACLVWTAMACADTAGPEQETSPLAPMGTLEVTSSPAGAAIRLNGAFTGERTPATFTKPARLYRVDLQLEGFERATDTVEVRQDVLTRVDVTLGRCRELLIASQSIAADRGFLARVSSPASTCPQIAGTTIPGLKDAVGVAALGDTVLVYTLRDGLVLSTDYLQSWSQIPGCPTLPTPEPFSTVIKELPIAVTSWQPLEGYLATGWHFDFLYHFTASTCTSLRSALPYVRSNVAPDLGEIGVQTIVLDPLNPGAAWLGGEATVWYMQDEGRSIEVVFRDLDARVWDVGVAPSDPQTIYAVGSAKKANGIRWIWRSVDKGITWTAFPHGTRSPFMAVVVDPTDSNHVYAGINGDIGIPGMYESFNGGATTQTSGLVSAAIADLVIDYPYVCVPGSCARIGTRAWQSVGEFLPGVGSGNAITVRR